MGFSEMSGVQQKTKKQAVKQQQKKQNKQKGQQKQRRRAAGKRRSRGMGGGDITGAYIRTLSDPWQYSGVKLGWGTMVDTTCAQAYVRLTGTSNADGSFAVFALPFISTITDTTSSNTYSLVSRLQGGLAVATSSLYAPADQAAIQANFGSIRPVSIGVRAYPNLALTVAPGQCFTGALPSMDLQTFAAITVNDLIAFPTTHESIGVNGGSSTGRPIDADSFEFSDDFLLAGEADSAVGTDPTTHIPMSIPYVAFAGIGSGTSVFIECVYNFEGTPKTMHSAAPLGVNENQGPTPTMASMWSNVETMWNSVKNVLPPSGRPTFTAATADGDSFRQSAQRAAKSYLLNNGAAAVGNFFHSAFQGGYGGSRGFRLLRE